MSDLTRQELCVKLHISQSTIQRMEKQGLPFIQYQWDRSKRYNLVAVGRWLQSTRTDSAPMLQGAPARNYYGANARAKAINRLPSWADKKAMKAIYEEARRLTQETGVLHQVDHVIPLCGREVSGFHVAENLQVLTYRENSMKHNHYEAA